MRIAVVDNSRDDVDLLIVFLAHRFGAGNVRSFRSSREFLAQFTLHSLDVVLLNLAMPQIDGYELLQQIRMIDAFVLAVALINETSQSHEGRALAAGFLYTITKPIWDFEQVCDDICRCVPWHGGDRSDGSA